MDGYTEKLVFTKLLLKISVRELHTRMASPPEECVLKEAGDKENNIIIINYVLGNILPPQLKNMSSRIKFT